MTSRLDRLFVLLESGSSGVTRRAAASQLGRVQRMHPHELHRLLQRVGPYVRSAQWETRIAAAHAVNAVLANTPQWDPVGVTTECSGSTAVPGQASTAAPGASGRLSYATFDMDRVLASSAHLMGSEGKEYDVEEQTQGVTWRETLARDRQRVNSQLGLPAVLQLDMDTDPLITVEDLKKMPRCSPQPLDNKMNVSEVVGLSCREMNRAKRKARQAVLKQSRSREDEDGGEQERKRIRTEGSMEGGPGDEGALLQLGLGDSVPDNTGAWPTDAVEWPLEAFCEWLCAGLFSPAWEVRHGSATAIRELVKTQGRGGGRAADIAVEKMEEAHQQWLEDVSLRLICVLALDRFGDFVSDQVVAPVRETSAQALGSLAHLMSRERVSSVMRVLLQLLDQGEWEARHGGLLGIKYILAVREDMLDSLLPTVVPHVATCLGDPVDDVGGVAAAALTPAAPSLPALLPASLARIVSQLWTQLAAGPPHHNKEQEVATTGAAATDSFMALLAALLTLPDTRTLISHDEPLSEVVPRLCPYLSHSTSSVRRATLRTLLTLTSEQQHCVQWGSQLLQPVLGHLMQRALVEHVPHIRDIVEQVWHNLVVNSSLDALLLAACPHVGSWLCLAMQPAKVPYDAALLVHDSPLDKKPAVGVRRPNHCFAAEADLKLFVGGSETTAAPLRESNVVPARCMAARMLGLLSCYIVKPSPGVSANAISESPTDCYVRVLLVHVTSRGAVQRLVAGLVVAAWWSHAQPLPHPPPPPALTAALTSALASAAEGRFCYDEVAATYSRLLHDARDFAATLKHYKLPFDHELYTKVVTMEQIQQLVGPVAQCLQVGSKLKPSVVRTLEGRRKAIRCDANTTLADQASLNVSTQAALAGAVLMLRSLPEKLNPVVKPLMDAIKREENEVLQGLAAHHLAQLVDLCVDRTPCPNIKIITNLCTFLRSDPEFTPRILPMGSEGGGGPSSDSGVESTGDSRTGTPVSFNANTNYNGILTLISQQKNAERTALRRSISTSGRGPGRPPSANDLSLDELLMQDDESQKANHIQRRGAMFALTAIASHFGADLPSKLPKLWEAMVGHLVEVIDPNSFDPVSVVNSNAGAEDLVATLQVLEVVSPAVHASLLPQILAMVPHVVATLSHPYCAVRHMASRCLAALASLATNTIMAAVVATVLPLLEVAHREAPRQGAVEAIAAIVDRMQIAIVPYVVLLVVPLLGRMSDHDTSVRMLATRCFATLVQLMPLDGSAPDPPGLTPRLTSERAFLEQLFNPKTIPDYIVPVPIRAQLRSYQQAGVNWLAFLNKYKLHGILCDDMGLGKTLQSICILAGDHFHRDRQYRLTGSPDCVPLPSLVVCPPTLTGHWVYEVEKFLSRSHLNPLQYAGPPLERDKLRARVGQHNLIVASYDIVRKDIDFFVSIKWNYCILDEGHVIKNGKTKSCRAIKRLVSNHRLILSGTPIQNNVLELWSLFDFLMPGLLGLERQFTAAYSRPILASRDAKSSPKEQEAGVLAMEALHRQVLPFVLRRMKEDVLKDLPPKITQDYYCDLSPLQEQLYEDFARSQSLSETLGAVATVPAQANTHIFQALRYLQNVCNHPKLVLIPSHPEFERISQQLTARNTSLADIQHAAKLPALRQLLLDCGIGVEMESQATDIVVNQHRALIFCQLKAMLDILETDLFKRSMPGLSYLRLDGSVPAGLRHSVVRRFNSDPSIDVLLLTTQVGGLGLNLTGADTVIFVEHDWSPMRDLQAMDRAHRIGQKKVVNVYRLITRATLEEKIMGLQKFKLMTANTVISGENAGIETMGTDKLLDLFALDSHGGPTSKLGNTGGGNSAGNTGGGNSATNSATLKTVLETLPELWEDKEYEEEYDLTNFVKTLRS